MKNTSSVCNFKLKLPFHVKNALANINDLKNKVDLVIIVSDARSLSATDVCVDLEKFFLGIKVLNLVSKNDLSDPSIKLDNSFNFKLQKNRKEIIKLIKKTLQSDYEKNKKLGYFNHFQILVVGLPNVGKSTLINLLKNKKISISENTPGVTKKIVKYCIEDNLWLYDSPGIFLHKNSKTELIQKLFFINSVIIPEEKYSEFLSAAFDYLKKYYLKKLISLVGVEEFDNYEDFIYLLAKKYNFKTKKNEWNTENAEKKFLFLIRNLKITWDKN